MGPEGAIAILYHKELAAADDPVALKKICWRSIGMRWLILISLTRRDLLMR